jgi:type VI secretion system secreted protein Hcp
MAADIFFKCDAKGETQDDKHKDEISILSFNLGVENLGTAARNQGIGASKLNAKNLRLRKYIDMSSPNLFQFCASGKHLDECVLTARKAGGDPLEYMVLTLKACMISAVNILGPDETDQVVEEIDVNYGSIKYAYTPQTAKGTGGSTVSANIDLTKGKFS